MTESTVGKRGFEPSKIMIYVKNRGIVLEESSMALVNRDTGLIIAMGNEAEEAMEAPPTPAVAVNALRRGIVAYFTLSANMFRYYLHRALGYDHSFVKRLIGITINKPRIAVCVPEELTEVEEKAFSEAFYQAGAKKVYLSGLPLENAVTSLGEQCSVFVGITWSGKEKERFCINENCPHRIF